MGFLMFSVILDSETISIAFDTLSLSAILCTFFTVKPCASSSPASLQSQLIFR